ncbi:hypothetical protein CAEBREN_15436 [Caenorhabditis brenneri]|uniref:Uncharacterized protein n=1 Tax=Caenorhabditis brenneri TaxID=135651 RepID=G0NNM2_CAEBE|nr:hypothetical protein CAEBREN_15436 [Caenorhabditis brenneri]
MFGQLFRPAQETGIKRAESMVSHQQTPIQHSPELNMSNGNCLDGSIGAEFSRLTEHLVFAFLGGYVSMDNLPCLGDLVNGIDEFQRTTSISINFYQEYSQIQSLDLNGNLHQLSAISMDLNFISRIMDDLCEGVKTSECYQKPVGNVSTLLDTLDASSTACSPPDHTSQRTDEIELFPEKSINAHFICNKSIIGILNLDCPTTNLPFQQCDFTENFVMSTIAFGLPTGSLDFNSVSATPVINLAFKLKEIDENQKAEIQEYDLHKHALASGNLESQFHRHHKNLNDFPGSNLCSTNALTKSEPIYDENTFAIPNPGTLMDYLYGDLEIPQFLDTKSSSMQSEDLCCIIGNNGEGSTFSVADPSQLMNFLYGDLESPVFLSSESIEQVVHSVSNYAGRYSNRSSEGKLITLSSDHTIEESHQCSPIMSRVIRQTISGMMTESLCDSNGFTNGVYVKRGRILSSSQFENESSGISDSKLSYHQDDFNVVANYSDKSTSKVHNASVTEAIRRLHENPTDLASNTNLSLYKNEDDEENIKTDSFPCFSNTSLMDKNSTRNSYENPEIYVPSPCCDHSNFNSFA